MSLHDRNLERTVARRPARLGLALGLFLTLSLLLVAQAAASYEVVGAFEGAPGPVPNNPSGIAINYTGAGGVPVGTLYTVNERQHVNESGASVLSYGAQGEFRQAWGWGVADEEREFERCGPAGEAAHPTCKGTKSKNEVVAFEGEGLGQLNRPEGIAVDQASGDVYVLNRQRAHNAVQIFSATGEPLGGLGEEVPESAPPSESIANAPEKIHSSNFANRIAVDASGTVYVGDAYFALGEGRVMVFKPETPGDFSSYKYTGQANDIGSHADTAGAVALDEAGNLYLANKEFISEFSPGEKTTPTCRYKVPGGQLGAVTVNPVSGEVFAISFSNLKFRQLAPCNAQGEFREKTSFSPVSKRVYSYPLAFDPALSYEPSRPKGILYSGNLVGEDEFAVEVFAPAEIHFPSVESESVSSVTTSSAVLHAQINPEGSQTGYVFQYLTQAAYEANEPDEIQSLTVGAAGGTFDLGFEGHRSSGLPFDASSGEVRQALESLPGIGAGNVAVSGGPGDESGSSPYRIQLVGELSNTDLPLIEADGSGLSGGSATAVVQGEHNGGGGFAGAVELPPGGAVLGSGQEPLSATAGLVGLQPDTSYRYRAVASSPCNPDEEEVPCEALGKTSAFRTFSSQTPGLPDHRAYELVSPADKAGGEVFRLNPWVSSCPECNQGAIAFPKQSSPDGEALVYEGGPFANSGTGLNENEYLARRTPSGWQSTNLTPPRLATLGAYDTGFKAFDTNFSRGLLTQVNPSLTPSAPSEYANLYGFSTADPADLSPLIGAEPPNRSPGRIPNGLLLVYAGATPDLSHSLFEANDALTGETSFAPEAVDGGVNKYNLYESVEGELRLVNVLPGNTETVPGASFGSGLALNKSYNDREYDFDNAISADGSRIFWSDKAGQVYVREDGERTTEIPDHTGKFLTATPDGSKLLLSDGVLYDLGSEAETDLTEGKGGFQGIAGNSEDLSSIYFVDTAVLNGGENERGERPQSGQSNLYLFRGGTATFIATLDGALDNELTHSLFGGDWRAPAGHRSAEASPSGRYLAFLSYARLTGVDNTGLCGFDNTGSRVTARCPEVFLYDSQTGRLSCPSCNPTGRSPLGESTLPISDPINSFYQTQPRYLTDEGRLYFNSQDSLSTFDTNEGVEDLYQYEPNGVGTCTRSAGCINLISAGRESVDSNFYAMSDGGRDVFFATRDQLALKDHDDLLDVYDAREDGGIASETETSRGECQGEACQVPVSPPNDPTPGSSTFEGAGNVVEPKAAKKHKKKRHAKKHSKKRAAKHNRGGAK